MNHADLDPELIRPYLAPDRYTALAHRIALPDRAHGVVLFADIAGFTALTAALATQLGMRRGAEEMTRQIDAVYAALIGVLDRYGGNVVGFSGDAITCWLANDDGLLATRCALAMQAAMAAFAALTVPDGTTLALTIKVAVASGPVRRFLVGDPAIQLLDVLSGATLDRLAHAETLARSGEVVLDAATAGGLAGRIPISAWRSAAAGDPVAVVGRLAVANPPAPHPAAASSPAPDLALTSWLLPAVAERLRAGNGEFLTELRPAVALFLRFGGLDDAADDAGAQLDGFVRWVQAVLRRFAGVLLQVSMGEKGSYLYAAFGAPTLHEDDAERAVAAALALRTPPPELGISPVQIGLAQGTLRTGAYGCATRRTYGVLGPAVNLAARLMQHAPPGQIWASRSVQVVTTDRFAWAAVPEVSLKGIAAAVPVWALHGRRTDHPQPDGGASALPLVGRTAELARLSAALERMLGGSGVIVGVTGEAGIGKSRLLAATLQQASQRRCAIYRGACQSYGGQSPYLAWEPIWRGLLGLDAAAPPAAQISALRQIVAALDPIVLPRLPLLGIVLNLAIPDTDLARSLDPQQRKTLREELLIQCLDAQRQRLRGEGRFLLLVLEDVHWIDPLSDDLLAQVGQNIAQHGGMLALTYRSPTLTGRPLPPPMALAAAEEIRLTELPHAATASLIQAKLLQLGFVTAGPLPASVIDQIMDRTHGNPFYMEELVTYLQSQGLDPSQEQVWADADLPTSLHRLILSRIDQLPERQQQTLKVASIIGRSFHVAWLGGYYPALGVVSQISYDLTALQRLELVVPEREVEPSYLFKHVITQEVTYESLPFATRALLHEQFAHYLQADNAPEAIKHLDLLAYHYEHSANDALAVLYLTRHAEQLARLFANASAIRQYRAALARVTASDRVAPVELWRGLGDVYAQIAEFDQALASYDQALGLLPAAAAAERFELQRRQIDLLVRATRFEAAWVAIDAARVGLGSFRADTAQVALAEAQLAELASVIYMRQANYSEAIAWAEGGLQLLKGTRRTADPQLVVARAKLYQALAAPSAVLGRLDLAQRAIGRAVRLVDSQQFPVLASELQLRLAILAMQRDQLRKAPRLFARTITLMEQIGARDRLAYTLLPGGQNLALGGRTAEALRWLERGTLLAGEVGSPFLLCAGHSLLTWINTILGSWDAALVHCEQGLELASEHLLRDRYIELQVRKIEILLSRGDYTQVETLLTHSLSYVGQYHLAHHYKFLCRLQAELYRILGRTAEATRAMEDHGISFSTQLQSPSHALADLGVVEWWALHMVHHPTNQPQLAASVVADRAHAGLLFLCSRQVRVHVPYAYRMNGLVALARQQPVEAARFFKTGLRVARAIQHLPDTARLLTCLGLVESNEGSANRRLKAAAALVARLKAQPEQRSLEQVIRDLISPHPD